MELEYEVTPEDYGYTHENDMPDIETAKDYVQGIVESLYETGDVEPLDSMLDELCHALGMKFEHRELKIQQKEEKMDKEIVVKETNELAVIKQTEDMCRTLMQSPHYSKMGQQGVYAIVQKAKSVGVSTLDALNGGMYFVQGKVEMGSAMMNQMIRQSGHSITKDRKSDETICILHGKRADNGDTWTESFSIADAKLAGIYRNQWMKYPKDMLFARALSRLARQLFPDVIKGCYVQGEISDAPLMDAPVEETQDIISSLQYEELEKTLSDNMSLRKNMLAYLKTKYDVESLQEMPLEMYQAAISRAKEAQISEEAASQ